MIAHVWPGAGRPTSWIDFQSCCKRGREARWAACADATIKSATKMGTIHAGCWIVFETAMPGEIALLSPKVRVTNAVVRVVLRTSTVARCRELPLRLSAATVALANAIPTSENGTITSAFTGLPRSNTRATIVALVVVKPMMMFDVARRPRSVDRGGAVRVRWSPRTAEPEPRNIAPL